MALCRVETQVKVKLSIILTMKLHDAQPSAVFEGVNYKYRYSPLAEYTVMWLLEAEVYRQWQDTSPKFSITWNDGKLDHKLARFLTHSSTSLLTQKGEGELKLDSIITRARRVPGNT